MVIKHTKINNNNELKLDGHKINTVQHYEYLGMVLDDKLAMNNYLDVIWNKTNRKIGIFAEISCFVSGKNSRSYLRMHDQLQTASRLHRLCNRIKVGG